MDDGLGVLDIELDVAIYSVDKLSNDMSQSTWFCIVEHHRDECIVLAPVRRELPMRTLT